MGSWSTDERVKKYSLQNLERDPSTNFQIRTEYAIKKDAEEDMYTIMDRIQIPEPSEAQIKEYLRGHWREHLSMMYDPPFWIVEYVDQLWGSEDAEGHWVEVGKGGKGNEQTSRTYYGLWKSGQDIAFIQPLQPRHDEVPSSRRPGERVLQNAQSGVKLGLQSRNGRRTYQEETLKFFNGLDSGQSAIPLAPAGNRPIAQLQDSPAVWAMSLKERQRLAEYWEEEMRRLAYHNHLGTFIELRQQYDNACERYQDVLDDVRV